MVVLVDPGPGLRLESGDGASVMLMAPVIFGVVMGWLILGACLIQFS